MTRRRFLNDFTSKSGLMHLLFLKQGQIFHELTAHQVQAYSLSDKEDGSLPAQIFQAPQPPAPSMPCLRGFAQA